MKIGSKLRLLRKSKGLSTSDLAAIVNISQSYYSRFENDKAVPDVVMLSSILDALGTTMSEFFAHDSEQLPPDLLQLIETAKKLTPEERKNLNLFLQSTLERTGKNE